MANLFYNVTNNSFGEIILTIRYFDDILPKTIQYIYTRNFLLNLYKSQDNENFMQYQFKYIVDNIVYPECKSLFLFKCQEIKEKILKLLGIE